MGLFDFGKTKKLERELEELKKLAFNARGFENLKLENIRNNFGRNQAVYPAYDISQQTGRYVTTDDIYSIIRRLATTAALVPLYGYLQTPDEKSFRKLIRERKGYLHPKRYKELQTKALEDLPDTDVVAQLLEHPNDNMSKYEFFVQLYSWLFMDGEAFILKQRPTEGTNAGMPIQLHFMPPSQVVIRVSETFPRRIVAYDYRINGVNIQENIPVEDVIHIKYFNPDITYAGDELRGLSPLKVLAKRLARLDSNMDVSVAQLQNSGVETIVYDKSLMADTEAAQIIGKRKDNFYKFISNPQNARAPYFASGEMGAVQLGSSLTDMGVIELGNVDFKKLCNAYGISDRLFNNDATGSEISDDNAHRGLYTNCVLPNVSMVRDSFINGILPDFKDGVVLDVEGEPLRIRGDGKNRFIDADISDITELNDDIGKLVTALAAAMWLTPNEKREAMNYERYDNPIFDEPLLPNNLQTLEDLIAPPILPTNNFTGT